MEDIEDHNCHIIVTVHNNNYYTAIKAIWTQSCEETGRIIYTDWEVQAGNGIPL